MICEKEFFSSIQPATGQVILGDGKSTLPIQGMGRVQMKTGDNTPIIPDVWYIPGLSESIYSLFLHIQTPLHGLKSSFEHRIDIILSILGQDDIYLDGIPASGLSGIEIYTALMLHNQVW